MEEAGKGAHQSAGASQAGCKWNAGKGADPKLAAAVRVLAAGLLLGWEQIHAKHPNHRSETAGQKCARRDEQLLQLLLRMHILATLATKLGALTDSTLITTIAAEGQFTCACQPAI